MTYERSRDARIEESAVKDVYTLVYDAPRPELFLKDAMMRRTVGPGAPIADPRRLEWNVPEPEIGLVLGKAGRIVGYTIGNDVSSRDIEGREPALPAAGEGLRGRVLVRPRRARRPTGAAQLPADSARHGRVGAEGVRGRDVDRADEALVRGARRAGS